MIKAKLSELCNSEIPIDVHLNYIDNYGFQTIYIAPGDNSKDELLRIMRRIQQNLNVKGLKISDAPHMSIARGLNQEKSIIANTLFKTIDMTFCCDRIALRRFDRQIRQFVVIDEFLFKSNPAPLERQLALF